MKPISTITHPVVGFVVLLCATGIRDLMVSVVSIDKILQDGAGLEDADGLPALQLVSQSGDPPVRIDLEKPWFFLRVFLQLDGCCLISSLAPS